MTTPTEDGTLIVEKLIGATGDPARVKSAGRTMAERAVGEISMTLNEIVASPVEIAVESVDLARVSDVRPAPGGFEAMTVVAASASPDALILLIEADAIALMIGAMFGADPEMPVTPIERDLSPTELEIADMTFRAFALALNGSGKRSIDIRLPLRPAMAGGDIQKQVLRDGPALKIVFVISNLASSGRLQMFVPQRVLLQHRSGNGGEEQASPGKWSARFGEEIRRSAVTLDAVLLLDRMTLGQLAALQTGQVIPVPEDAPTETRLVARDKTVFIGEFGKLGQNYTVRIDRPYDANQDFMEGLLPG